MTAAYGKLIVLEGPDGVGKTTQAARLAEHVRVKGHPVLSLREPGGTPLGDVLRQLLLDPSREVEPAAEALMFLASRAQLVQRVIRPALMNGTIVVLDRFFLSTYAYQIGGQGLSEAAIREANALAVQGVVPDVTVLFKYPVVAGLDRAQAATHAGDRMHALGVEFHQRVADAFAMFGTPAWQRAHEECGPIVTIDASGSVDEVGARVRSAVGQLGVQW